MSIGSGADAADARDIDVVMGLERELQTAPCRRDAARVRMLLADDFDEVGASGRVWDRAATLELLAADDGEAEIEVHDMTARVVGEGFLLVRWVSDRGGRRARRTSLWRRDPKGWRLVHHQGTPLPRE
jgi:ribonuclease HI